MKTGGRNIHNLRSAGDTTFLEESSSDFKQLLMKVKQESTKAGLHFNIKKTKVMTTEEMHKFHIDSGNVPKRLNILLHSLIQMETTANKSRKC